ncbi:adenosylcobinamide-phosphate synthase CbiB [Mediterraneibacter sp. ICN-202921]|uniref:adenosylcobinamide-phosphate synthase CbiB n=1 Tax=Mediterraneibacter sp. ICN-202921 TaxID=3134657 RepID=UPI0030BB77D1
MVSLAACVTGFLLDLLFGDPVWLYHPVRLIGRWITFLEKQIFGFCEKYTEEKMKAKKLLIGGGFLWVSVVLVSTGIPCLLLLLAGKIHPVFAFCLETFWCYQLLAAASLRKESKKVYEKLTKGTLAEARKAVSMIVGRDTEALDEKGVIKAAVETVAENTSDGEVAPLIFLLLGGAPLGFFYKAVNTMDSMVGYKNEKYLYLGRIPAKLDDVMNFIPARVSAVIMILSSFLLRMDGKNAYKVYKKDRRKHASPNAAQTESVCAGALDIELAGDAFYFGKRVHKETIGIPYREPEAEDIVRAGKLLYMTAFLTLLILGGGKACVLLM